MRWTMTGVSSSSLLIAGTRRLNVMRFLILVSVVVFLSSTHTEQRLLQPSLKVVTPLKNGTFRNNVEVVLRCKIENATSYHWYKDQKPLYAKRRKIKIKRNKVKIKQFEKKYAGKYTCKGEDGNGNFATTKAFIRLEDKGCGPEWEKYSQCLPFTASKCPHLASFAPQPKDLTIEIRIDYKAKPHYRVGLLLKWIIPVKDRRNIWAWQITIFGKDNIAGYQNCIQINRMNIWGGDIAYLPEYLPYAHSTYEVAVQSLPSLHEAVVRGTIAIPSWCELVDRYKPCCETYINASVVVGKNNKATLFWKTYYPSSLNVSIAGFNVRWISEPYHRCNSKGVLLDLHKSNYTFPNLTASCGNYSIIIEVRFNDTVCEESPQKTILYLPPTVLKPLPTKSSARRGNTIATVCFAMAASILVGILIVTYIILWRRKKKTDLSEPLIQEPNNELVKVFILNPNHCKLCTDVVHTLGALLIKTGYIDCRIDMFVPLRKMGQGPISWNEDMIKNSEYVIIPWMSERSPPTQAIKDVHDMNAVIFTSSLEIIRAELLKNPNNKVKFIPVYLDHCSIEILPPNHVLLHTYNIPSKIDDLVVELMGKTRRRPDLHRPILQFDDSDYITAKRNLENAIVRLKKCHPETHQKNQQRNI